MVVFTDGWVNKGPDPEQMAREAQGQEFEIFSVSYNVSFWVCEKRKKCSEGPF